MAELRFECPYVDDPEIDAPHYLQLCYPVWVPANDPAFGDRAAWELDIDAQPWKDGDKGWCRACQMHVLPNTVDHEPRLRPKASHRPGPGAPTPKG